MNNKKLKKIMTDLAAGHISQEDFEVKFAELKFEEMDNKKVKPKKKNTRKRKNKPREEENEK